MKTTPTRYSIAEIDQEGRHLVTVSGIGRNRGTLDTEARSRRTARRWLASLRRENPGKAYRIDEI